MEKSKTGNTTPQGTATLQGTVYEVKDPSGKVVATLTTNAQGKASTGNLPVGDYTLTVKETKASCGFEQDPTNYTVERIADNMKDTEKELTGSQNEVRTTDVYQNDGGDTPAKEENKWKYMDWDFGLLFLIILVIGGIGGEILLYRYLAGL